MDHLLNSNLFLLAVEAAGLLTAGCLALFRQPELVLTHWEQAFTRLANHRNWSVALCFLAVVVGRLALLTLFPVPVPGVHDEFSYLLSGATFASGHLANATDQMWPFFESFHILQQPHYVSMYPVAPGLFLAVGFLAGLPWLGVLLPVALFCSAVIWALQGWIAPKWALVGGLLAVIKFGLVCYWIDSYWGGSVPALGGALVLGAAPRLLERAMVQDALALALGLLVLANSRPFEGFVLAFSVLLWLGFQLLTKHEAWQTRKLLASTSPALAVLVLGFTLMGFYFKQTTGGILTMPYVRYAQEYSIAPAFLWEKLHPEPVFHHTVMQQYYERERPLYYRSHTMSGWLTEVYRKLSSFSMFYLWPGILLTVFLIPRLLKVREGRASLFFISAVILGVSFEIWPMMLHYPAPATAATLLLLVSAMKAVRTFSIRGLPVGQGLSRSIPAVCLLALSLRVVAEARHLPVPEHGLIPYLTVAPGNLQREQVISELNKYPGKHLVIVRYGTHHDISHEWVYNSPSICNERIVWAREMDPDANKRLVHHFTGRDVWLVEPDQQPTLLKPYSPDLQQGDAAPLVSR